MSGVTASTTINASIMVVIGIDAAAPIKLLSADAAQGTRFGGNMILPVCGSVNIATAPATSALAAARMTTVQASPRGSDSATSIIFVVMMSAASAANTAGNEKSISQTVTANRMPRLSLTNSGNLQRINFGPAISNASMTAQTSMPATKP